MIQPLGLVGGLAGQVDPQLAQHIHVRLGQNHAGMYLGALQVLQLLDGALCLFVGNGTDGEGDQELVRVETGILVAQINQALDGRLDLFPDGLHPNDGGHRIMAETLVKTLKENRLQSPEKFDFIMRRAGHYRIMGYIISISETAAKGGMTCFYGISKDEFCYSSCGQVTLESPFRLYLEPVRCQSDSDIAIPAGVWNEYRRALTVKLPSTGGKLVKVKIVPAKK